MAMIHELTPHIADLIAAGEVVERPASVAKELLENSIDAEARQITVEIANGGITFLRVTDDGCGIAAEDVPVAFRRHATSKLHTEEDLSAIGTLGFRGEALAAISAVSRIDLLTKQKGCLAGTHLSIEAGQAMKYEDAGCPDGTTFIVRDLFFNTPARMKFLKKDFTEAGYVFAVVQHAALSHPEISFIMIRDGKQVFCTAGDGHLKTPVFAVFGRELTEHLIEIKPCERDGLCVWGTITKPHAVRSNRSMQHFFVNGRYVKNRTMQAAFEEAYRNKIITGKYPSGVLCLSIPLAAVDVNVHPAKTEIKFSHEKQVFEAVYAACKNTIENHDNIPNIAIKRPDVREDTVTEEQQKITVLIPEKTHAATTNHDEPSAHVWRAPIIECDDFTSDGTYGNVLKQPPLAIETKILQPAIALHPMPALAKKQEAMDLPRKSPTTISPTPTPLDCGARVIGEAFHTYIVCEDGDSILLIDKHAAHERIIFNKLRQTTDIPQQRVLTPVIVELAPTESTAIMQHINEIRSTGFDIDPFGTDSFAVRGVPAYLDHEDVTPVLSEMAAKLLSNRAAVSDRRDDLIHMVSCKAAIKAGSHSNIAELQALCDRVLTDPEIMSCPHGRPVTVRLTRYELDKLFKRVNQ